MDKCKKRRRSTVRVCERKNVSGFDRVIVSFGLSVYVWKRTVNVLFFFLVLLFVCMLLFCSSVF